MQLLTTTGTGQFNSGMGGSITSGAGQLITPAAGRLGSALARLSDTLAEGKRVSRLEGRIGGSGADKWAWGTSVAGKAGS